MGRRTTLAAATAAVMVLSACAGGNGDSPTAQPTAPNVTADVTEQATPPPEPPSPSPTLTASPSPTVQLGAEEALPFFEAVATNRPDQMTAAIDMAADGSPAHAYATFQTNWVRAARQAGVAADPASARQVGEQVELCPQPDACYRIDGFEWDDTGNLTTFKAEGSPVGAQVAGGGGTAQQFSATFEVLAAYKSIDLNRVFVVVHVTAGDQAVDVFGHSATYVDADGTQTQASDAFAPDTLRPGAAANVGMTFDQAVIGGTLYIPVSTDASNAEVQLPVEAPFESS